MIIRVGDSDSSSRGGKESANSKGRKILSDDLTHDDDGGIIVMDRSNAVHRLFPSLNYPVISIPIAWVTFRLVEIWVYGQTLILKPSSLIDIEHNPDT